MSVNIKLPIHEAKKLISHLKSGRWAEIFFDDNLGSWDATCLQHLKDIKDNKIITRWNPL